MNRLLLTILLVLAFAISFATLAHAQDATTSTPGKTTKHVGHKPSTDSTAKTATTTAAPAPAADPAPAATTPQIKDVSDICQGDKDCGRATVDLGGDKESKLTAMKVDDDSIEVTQVCAHCDGVVGYKPVRMKLDPSKSREDLRKGLDDIMKEASSQIKGLSKLQDELNAKIASCEITDESSIIWKNGKPKLDAKVFKADDDNVDADEDFSNAGHRTASVKSKQEECYETNLEKFADSDDPKEKKAASKIMAAYENRLSVLSREAALGLLSENELEEYSRLTKFQNETILSKDNPALNKLASNFWKDKMLSQNGEQATMQASLAQLLSIDPKNGTALWGALSNPNLNKASLKGYASDMQLAVAATGAAANRGDAYNTTAQQMLAWQTAPTTMMNEVNHLSSEVPAKIRATSVASASDPLQAMINMAATAKDDSSTADGNYDQNLAHAKAIAKRVANDPSNLGDEAITATMVQNGPNFGLLNSNMSNMRANFRVGSYGSGQSQLPNNANPGLTSTNSWANNVIGQNNFGNNFQTNSFPGNNFQSTVYTGNGASQNLVTSNNYGFSGSNSGAGSNSGFTFHSAH